MQELSVGNGYLQKMILIIIISLLSFMKQDKMN